MDLFFMCSRTSLKSLDAATDEANPKSTVTSAMPSQENIPHRVSCIQYFGVYRSMKSALVRLAPPALASAIRQRDAQPYSSNLSSWSLFIGGCANVA